MRRTDRRGGKVGLHFTRPALDEAIFVEDRELVHRRLPVVRRAAPVGGDVAQRQPDQLGGRIVAGEVAARLDDLAQLRVDALDGVGGVDHLAHRRREREERNHVVPGAAPGGRDGGEFLTPGAALEGIQLGLAPLRRSVRRVDRLDRRGQRLAILPARVVQAVADQVHDAGLQRGGREHRRQRLGHALQAIGDGDQDVVHAAGLQVVEHLHPELGALGVLDPQPQDVARAVGQHAQRQVDRLVAHHRVLADLHAQRVEEDHRVHRLQRPGLPGGDLGHDRVGDRADELGRHLRAVAAPAGSPGSRASSCRARTWPRSCRRSR